MFWFSVRSTCTMRSTGSPSAVIFSLERSTRIWRRSPPWTVTAATPLTRSRRGESVRSAISRRATGSTSPSPWTAIDMIGHDDESNLKITGGSASSGRRPRMRSMRLRRSSAASPRSVPHTKLSRVVLLPSDEVELSWSRPATALTVCSIGRVIDSSISRGPTPGYATRTVRLGNVRSGSRSTGSWTSEIEPSSTITALIMNIVTGRSMAVRGILMGVMS